MIQFNLLPSVKLEYVRAKRNKRLAILISSSIGAASVAILLLLFVNIQYIQAKYSKALSADIKTESKKLEGINDLNKILTIQNQLNSLPALHDQKPVTSLLYGYIKQFTPAKVSIASLDVNFDDQIMTITGTSESINIVNKFIDTLKFTTYSTTTIVEGKKVITPGGNAFSVVTLTSFGRDDKGAKYELSMKYDPAIFSSTGTPVLIIPPGKITTRSEIEKPGEKTDDIFKPLSNSNGAKQ